MLYIYIVYIILMFVLSWNILIVSWNIFISLITNNSIQNFITIWAVFELINWFVYLYMYLKIINPRSVYYKENDIKKIIGRVDKLSSEEIEHIIKGCVIYDKVTHEKIDPYKFDIKAMTKKEVIYLIGYSLFGIEYDNIYQSNKFIEIYKLLIKIENMIQYKFSNANTNRYLYRLWGQSFIEFNFKPLIIMVPIRIIINLFHYYMIWRLKFKYTNCSKSKIGYLYKDQDPCKKNLVFIHGFGFGYTPYIRRLQTLNAKYNLIIIILPNISNYTYYDEIHSGYFPPLDIIKNSFYDFMEKYTINNNNKLNKINILSHSFGTYIAQIIKKDARNNIIDKIIMIDPIIFWIGCFKMSLYIEKQTEYKDSIVEYVYEIARYYLIYQCMYLKFICHRVMFGPDFWIYNSKELEGKNILLVLEYDDHVIPCEILYNKIKRKNISYYYLANADHGQVLLSPKFDDVFDEIINYYD